MSEIRRYHVVGGALTRKGRPNLTAPEPDPPTERFPGDPDSKVSGRFFYGQARGTNDSVTFRETEMSGASIPVRRRYWTADQSLAAIAPPSGGLLAAVREDHAANRMPWVSFKLDWAGVASGVYDSQLTAMITNLNANAKPVILTMGHEPENDGLNPVDWRAAQVRVRARINAWKAANPTLPNRIAFVSNLMTYTWSTLSGRNPESWWAGAGVHDAVTANHYTEPSAAIIRQPLTDYAAWCVAKGVPMGSGEVGVRPEDPAGATKLQALYDFFGSRDTFAVVYFDSASNSTGTGWVLTGTALTKHRALMQAPGTVRLSDLGY